MARRLLLVLAPLLLVAASGPPRAAADQPAPQVDLQTQFSLAPSVWLPLLAAPATGPDWRPPDGPRLAWPVRARLSQPFGCTGFGLEPSTDACAVGFHYGIDLAAPMWTPVQAAADGLAYPFPDTQLYGNHVLIQHQAGLATVYGHLVGLNVGWGQAVRQGDVIGWVGSTGNSTGPHLHFEVRFAANPYDPMPYLAGSPPDPFALPAGWPGMPPDDFYGRS
ncbi:MAG: M23 family metallopeptidase [Chloroflexi bacterium]|nr:MAG: M23 family metallopeptidase [Chloroflexota bacterium]TME14015.1 MAG: M23 family metallopeptidase [Chloroflexota bacterium]